MGRGVPLKPTQAPFAARLWACCKKKMYKVFREFEEDERKAAGTIQLILPQLQEAVEHLKKASQTSELLQDSMAKLGVSSLTLHKLPPATIIQLYAGYQYQMLTQLREQNEKLTQQCLVLQKDKETLELQNQRLKKKRKEETSLLKELQERQERRHEELGDAPHAARPLETEGDFRGTRPTGRVPQEEPSKKQKTQNAFFEKEGDSRLRELCYGVHEHTRGVFTHFNIINTEQGLNVLVRLYRECERQFFELSSGYKNANELRKSVRSNLCAILEYNNIGGEILEMFSNGIDALFRKYMEDGAAKKNKN